MPAAALLAPARPVSRKLHRRMTLPDLRVRAIAMFSFHLVILVRADREDREDCTLVNSQTFGPGDHAARSCMGIQYTDHWTDVQPSPNPSREGEAVAVP